MKRSHALLLAVALGAFGLFQPTSSQAQAVTETQINFFPVEFFAFIPCANADVGEVVRFTGEIRDVFHVTTDGNNGFHIKFTDTWQGVSGTGLTTGDIYQVKGAFTQNGVFEMTPGSQSTYSETRVYIGPATRVLVRAISHLTVNADGTVTSFRDNFFAKCKGAA